MYSHTHMYWVGAGWYAPRMEGNICFLYYLGVYPHSYDASQRATQLNLGTPQYYDEVPTRDDFFIQDCTDTSR